MFFCQKKRKQSRRKWPKNETWKAYTDGIWTINLSRDDPACINLCIQGVFGSVKPQFWQKNILPFLTAAQRKHVQIHVMKTCRQASVTNSLLTLNFSCYIFKWQHNPEWIKVLLGCSKPRLHSHHKYFVNEQCLITSFHNLFSKFSG